LACRPPDRFRPDLSVPSWVEPALLSSLRPLWTGGWGPTAWLWWAPGPGASDCREARTSTCPSPSLG
jgi:hypothetical protein